jgi:hypothetical protein
VWCCKSLLEDWLLEVLEDTSPAMHPTTTNHKPHAVLVAAASWSVLPQVAA